MKNFNDTDTICALATGGGMSAIALIRISGIDAIKISDKFSAKTYQIKKVILYILVILLIEIT